MAFEFELPDVGEGIAEGEIVAWHVAPGEGVEEDHVMADVETDKAVVDLPAPVTGTVVDLRAEEGEIVPVGDVVAVIETEIDETPSEETPSEETTDAPAGDGRVFAPPNVRRLAREEGVDITGIEGSGPSGRVTEADVRAAAEDDTEGALATAEDDTEGALATAEDDTEGAPATAEDDTEGAPAAAEDDTESEPAVAEAVETRTGRSAVGPRGDGDVAAEAVATADRDRTLAAPATRGLAREEGVDIDEVPTEKTRDGEAFVEPEDVRAFLDRAAAEAGAEPTAPTETATPTPDREVTTEPYRGVRRTIGQQMEQSKFTAPHVTHHDTADVSALVETRRQLTERAEKRGISLTYMPFVIKAVIAALEEYPMLNSELLEDEEQIRYKQYYNIGIAVATDAGLMVPVVKNADQKGALQLASEVSELAARARDRKLSPEEMQDGTFTITNFGVFGGEYATPIINHPETAILGLGELTERPVVDDGEVVARHTLPLSLTIDHRVIDGAEAAQFCNTVMEYLENPTLLLLE